MSRQVDVVVDPDDDIATVRAIRSLAEARRDVVVIAIPPHARGERSIAWAILRGLGKRFDRLAGDPPSWALARTWLQAHRTIELVILRAQHLRQADHDDLLDLAYDLRIRVVLIYSGPGARGRTPTRPLADLLHRRRRAHSAPTAQVRWPTVPRSHPLRLRHDCQQQLPAEAFRPIDALLCETTWVVEGWLRYPGRPTTDALTQLVDVLGAAADSDQRYLRRSAISIALHAHGFAITPDQLPPPTHRRAPANPAGVDDALSCSGPAAAAYRLASTITGASADIVALIGGDQMSAASISDRPVPERAQPIVRAVMGEQHPISASLPLERQIPIDAPRIDYTGKPLTPHDEWIAELLRGRASIVYHDDLDGRDLELARDLLHAEVLDAYEGVIRASYIALYSAYRLLMPPIPYRPRDY